MVLKKSYFFRTDFCYFYLFTFTVLYLLSDGSMMVVIVLHWLTQCNTPPYTSIESFWYLIKSLREENSAYLKTLPTQHPPTQRFISGLSRCVYTVRLWMIDTTALCLLHQSFTPVYTPQKKIRKKTFKCSRFKNQWHLMKKVQIQKWPSYGLKKENHSKT